MTQVSLLASTGQHCLSLVGRTGCSQGSIAFLQWAGQAVRRAALPCSSGQGSLFTGQPCLSLVGRTAFHSAVLTFLKGQDSLFTGCYTAAC